MCGFVGLIGNNILCEKKLPIMIRSAAQISHRGPDESVIYVDDKSIICFHRLAIIGGKKGSQPFISQDQQLIVAVNGEIYNYKSCQALLGNTELFTKSSDCEVVLHLYKRYGIAMLDKIRGMFSMVLYDKISQSVFLIRDKTGIKPLYYALHRNAIYFASEIKALMAIPELEVTFDVAAALSEPWLAGFPAYNHTEPYSLFKNVFYLPGGTLLTYSVLKDSMHMQKYWETHVACIDDAISLTEYQACYKHALITAVKEESFCEADIGLLLSGGIDSSVIAYLAANHTNLISFSIDATTFIENEDLFWSKKVAQKVAIPHYAIPFIDTIKHIESWVNLVYLCETPYVGPEQIYKYPIYQYIKTTFPSIRVVFSGQGSDEFNGGYSVQFGGTGPDGWQNFLMILDHMQYNTNNWTTNNITQWWNSIPNQHEIEMVRSGYIEPILCNKHCSNSDKWMGYLKTKIRDLQMYNLWQEDRLAAAAGLENRVPFLNDLVLDAILSIPKPLHSKLFWDKYILRHAFQKELGDAIAYRPKVPLFYGRGQSSTIQMVLHLITRNNFELVHFAYPRAHSNNWLNKDHLIHTIRQISSNPPYKGWEKVLRLINIGLLERMHYTIGQQHTNFHYRLMRA